MAASFTIAARNNGATRSQAAAVTAAAVRAYREAMATFAQMGVMELWYTHMAEEDLRAVFGRLAAKAPHHKHGKSHRKDKRGKDNKSATPADPGRPGSAAWVAKQAEKKGVQANRYLYWRQLRDMKGSALVDSMSALLLEFYAGICGWTLARAHARSGDPIAITEYLGPGDAFDTAVTEFSRRYAEQNEKDYQAMVTAVRSGRLPAVEGV